MVSGTRFVDKSKFVCALHSILPSGAVPKWVSLKGYNHLTAIVTFKNATTVTGSAIGLSQATNVAGATPKVVPFTKTWANLDDAASVALTETAVVSNTFTTSAVNSKSGFYIIEVDADDLDINNGFDCIQVTVGNGVANAIEVDYILGNIPRYSGEPGSFADPLLD
jgi:hypothetical protein